MVALQRYISKELTHFIGKNLVTEEERYNLLVKVIKEGYLKSEGAISGDFKITYDIGFDPEMIRMSENRVFNTNMVCFCDIPVEDLDLHMNKYSDFGLAFLKTYLISKGANPVYYIANNSISYKGKIRSAYFDEIPEQYDIFSRHLGAILESMKKANQNVTSLEENWQYLNTFLLAYVFCYMKCFDDSKSEDDSKNYYMEREWRILGFLKFDINEIYRIILPKEYSERFRKDVPEYFGQLTFSKAK